MIFLLFFSLGCDSFDWGVWDTDPDPCILYAAYIAESCDCLTSNDNCSRYVSITYQEYVRLRNLQYPEECLYVQTIDI